MLARLQRTVVFCMFAGVLAWLGWSWHRDLSVPAMVAGALVIGMAHAWVLAIEFALLRSVDPGAGLPRPGLAALARAWWGEVRTGLHVFGWRQPFRSQVHPDTMDPVTSRGRRGVVLIHGFVCNRGLWNPWMPRLRAAEVPHAAVNLEPVFGGISDYVPIIEDAVARMEAATGLPPLVVAHSMGGLAVRAWLRDMAADHRIHAVITVGSPHHGTWLARFAITANTRQMGRFNRWLLALAADEPAQRRQRFTCFYSHCDNIVFPASTSMLEGADNRHVPGVAHVHLVYQPVVWNEVLSRLGPDSAVG